MVLITLLVAITLAGNLIHSRTVRALVAIRDNEIAAAPMGINVSAYKTLIFGFSAALAGIAGGFVALLIDFAAPDSYTFMSGALLLIGAVAGGLQSAWGAIFGGLFVQFLPDLSSSASTMLTMPAQGFVLLALIYRFPLGIAGEITHRLPCMNRPRPEHTSLNWLYIPAEISNTSSRQACGCLRPCQTKIPNQTKKHRQDAPAAVGPCSASRQHAALQEAGQEDM